MRSHLPGIALLGLLLCSCLDLGVGVAPPTAEPTPQPEASHTPTTGRPATPPAPDPGGATAPSPTPTPVPKPEPAEPFALVVAQIYLDDLDDSVVTGGPTTPVVDAAGLSAVQQAAAILELYLDRAFLDPGTRFTAAPANDLLTLSALSRLTPEAKTGLGAIDLDVTSSRAGPASANARVAILGETVLYVTLDYQAQVSVFLTDGRGGMVQQRGSLVFVPTAAGSRAEFAEVMLLLPWEAP